MLETGFFTRKRVRLIRQTEIAECGLACLAMISTFHGQEVNLVGLRQRFAMSNRGANLAALMKISDRLNLSPRALKLELEGLGALKLPAILHWQMTHFVVLAEVRRDRALIYDPRGSVEWVGMRELAERFTGIALELTPTAEFSPSEAADRLRLRQLWGRLTGLKRVFAQTLLLSAVLQIYILASPYYMQVIIDSALPALDRNLILVLAVGFGLLTLLNAVASLLRSFVLLSAGSNFAFGLSANLTRKLLRLPVGWFERRHVGDVLSRYTSIIPIRTMMIEGTVATVMDGLLAVLTLVMMAFYSLTLTVISIVALALFLTLRNLSFAAQRSAQESAVIAVGREQTSLIESIRGIVTIRLFGRETLRNALWQSKLVDSMNSTIHVQRIGLWLGFGNAVISGLENIAVIALGANLVLSGGFTVGMLFAFIAYKTQFSSTMQTLIARGVDFRMLNLHLDRLSDIVLNDDDPTLAESGAERALRGDIELRHVAYRYGLDEPLVLADLDLRVRAGESVAITGPSGGGKSTLVKVLLGLIAMDSGEMLVDGIPIAQFGFATYREQIAAVMQDDALFEGTIAANIAMFDESADLESVRQAATMAAIADDIEAMPMRYDTLIGDMGNALSGGQRQRVLLARALYRKPRVLIVDEATSHLDMERERQVNASIAALGITRVIIAHRTETIASADRVLRLENGKLREP